MKLIKIAYIQMRLTRKKQIADIAAGIIAKRVN